ncbi:MAG TPA: transposase [Gammaproteobacteria bacterium]|nr:transposase [Gammaproteobacteria bacterium]
MEMVCCNYVGFCYGYCCYYKVNKLLNSTNKTFEFAHKKHALGLPLATLQDMGIVPSLSRPSVSDDNPYSESLFRTLKYIPAYPSKPFVSLQEARQWVHRFVQWYNDEHRHSGIQYVTPNQRHAGLDTDLLVERKKVYEKAKKQNPERWSGNIRNWEPVTEVWLNPPKDLHVEQPVIAKAA